MKYYSDLHSGKVIKKDKIFKFYGNENTESDVRSKNVKQMFSSGTPQLNIGKYQWGALYNPKNSRSTIYVENISLVNFSNNPIVQSCYLNPKMNYEGFKYMYGNSNILESHFNSNAVVIFYQGDENLLFPNEPNFLRISQPFYTDNMQKDGNIVIPPGKSILILAKALDNSNTSCAINYLWHEK